jgi:hypothetical protein
MMNGFPKTFAEAKEKLLPFGEMVSKGEVKFEARENVWKGVESSYFPIFPGTKIRIEKGVGVVTLSNKSQIEVSSNSLFSFDQSDRFVLSQGSIEFRIPAASEIDFKVRSLSIMKSRAFQAGKGPKTYSPDIEETIGSISTHPNGAVTVKSLKGKLTVVSQDRVVLAAVSPMDSVTIPSITVGAKPPVKVAQVGETAVGAETETFLGLYGESLLWLAGALGLGATIWGVSEIIEDDDDDEVPVCP